MNNRMKVAITVILVGAVAIAAAVGVWYYKTKFYVPDKGGMERDLSDTVISCSYSTGGGMNGGSMSMRIFLNENNEVWFEYYNQPFVGAEEESASYRIDNTAIEQIRQKCSEYGVLGWGELELSELQLLDAPTTSVSFVYGDNEYYSVRSDYDLPEQGYGFFSAFYKILEQYKTQGGN
ncbi:MAG: hypothetical protein IJZ07_03710 [Clostridia bacterium]|nr:hypothetical protein [Clostridia bacterium]